MKQISFKTAVKKAVEFEGKSVTYWLQAVVAIYLNVDSWDSKAELITEVEPLLSGYTSTAVKKRRALLTNFYTIFKNNSVEENKFIINQLNKLVDDKQLKDFETLYKISTALKKDDIDIAIKKAMDKIASQKMGGKKTSHKKNKVIPISELATDIGLIKFSSLKRDEKIKVIEEILTSLQNEVFNIPDKILGTIYADLVKIVKSLPIGEKIKEGV